MLGLDSGARREAVGKGKIGHSNSQPAVNILLPYSNDLFLRPSPAVAARRRAPEQMLHWRADWTPSLRPHFPRGRVRRWEGGWESVVPVDQSGPGDGTTYRRFPGPRGRVWLFRFLPSSSLIFWVGRMASRTRAGEMWNGALCVVDGTGAGYKTTSCCPRRPDDPSRSALLDVSSTFWKQWRCDFTGSFLRNQVRGPWQRHSQNWGHPGMPLWSMVA